MTRLPHEKARPNSPTEECHRVDDVWMGMWVWCVEGVVGAWMMCADGVWMVCECQLWFWWYTARVKRTHRQKQSGKRHARRTVASYEEISRSDGASKIPV